MIRVNQVSCKSFLIYILSLASINIFAAENSTLEKANIDTRLSYEQYHMPDTIPDMGVLGLHALVDLYQGLYGGLGLYSAVSGDRGGYFGLALEGGFKYPLWQQLSLDTGARIGGGGGHNTPVGGGLFLEPYLGLKYNFQYFQLGAYYSYINFTSGTIRSQQLGIEVTVPFTFYYAVDAIPNDIYWDTTNNYIAGMARSYLLNQNLTLTSNTPMESHFEFLGFEFGHYLTPNLFAFFNMAGAFHGHRNGYADELLGLGYRQTLWQSPLDLVLKLGAGSGGGGAVNTGGGFIYEPTIGLEYHITSRFGIELNTGFVQAPQSDFKGQEVSVLIKYYLSDQNKSADLEQWQVRLLNQTYFKPITEDNHIHQNMQLLAADLDYFIFPHVYVTGQTAFAYVGQNTGGYFSGMLGIGAQTPYVYNNKLSFFGELLGGTAGGSGLSIGQGALIEPVLGINYQINKSLGLQTSAGRLIALQGKFNSTTMNAGIYYKFYSLA